MLLCFLKAKVTLIRVKSGFTGAYSTCTPSTSSTNVPEKEVLAGFADEGTLTGTRINWKDFEEFNGVQLPLEVAKAT
ncbi:hypothetical protein Tco_0245924 [Tanacetum coccineum]